MARLLVVWLRQTIQNDGGCAVAFEIMIVSYPAYHSVPRQATGGMYKLNHDQGSDSHDVSLDPRKKYYVLEFLVRKQGAMIML
jgi:hypothetical protein